MRGDSVNRGEGGVFAEIGESVVVCSVVIEVESERDKSGGIRVNRSMDPFCIGEEGRGGGQRRGRCGEDDGESGDDEGDVRTRGSGVID